ncbi:hypothetical protein [Alcaligenes endophyticus]|uniref:Uncharacterized protein n=1 Tax=Alcaligenes endophyticus TaxID=1929088 RepID=A0ABT8EKM4_9BURK|nr:hypothetical protein [Alcaligenes endophyticus]MCX5590896.1 hypothetical protein [Alcaligenes endophyticus]MDN4121742.1 hypothetical protein [Alcaligenes endophyticus]
MPAQAGALVGGFNRGQQLKKLHRTQAASLAGSPQLHGGVLGIAVTVTILIVSCTRAGSPPIKLESSMSAVKIARESYEALCTLLEKLKAIDIPEPNNLGCFVVRADDFSIAVNESGVPYNAVAPSLAAWLVDEASARAVTIASGPIKAATISNVPSSNALAAHADELSASGYETSAAPKINIAGVEVNIKEPAHKEDLDLLRDRIAALEGYINSLQMAAASIQNDVNHALAAK